MKLSQSLKDEFLNFSVKPMKHHLHKVLGMGFRLSLKAPNSLLDEGINGLLRMAALRLAHLACFKKFLLLLFKHGLDVPLPRLHILTEFSAFIQTVLDFLGQRIIDFV